MRGALTLEVIPRAKEQGVALPGAISAGTPMSDATKTGDSFYSNEMVDNVLTARYDNLRRAQNARLGQSWRVSRAV